MTVLCPRQTPKLSRLTVSPQVLITAGTRIITCDSRVFHVLHVFTTCVTRGCPWAKFWAVQNFLPSSTLFRFFSASCHVYKSTVARLKLDINANNIVCFTRQLFDELWPWSSRKALCDRALMADNLSTIMAFSGTISGLWNTAEIPASLVLCVHNTLLRTQNSQQIRIFPISI